MRPLHKLLAGAGLLASLVAAPLAGRTAETLPVRAGAAWEPFKLPQGVPLAGYSKRKGRPSAGAHDAVGARAVVLEQGTTQVVLVSADLLIIDEHLYAAVRRRLPEAGVRAEATLWLAATHTHSGPGAYGTRFAEKVSMGHFDPGVLEALVAAIVQAAARARAQLVPVGLGYRAARVEGLVKNRVTDAGLVDDSLIVAGLYPLDAPARPLAILASFAAHPTSLGAQNRQLSGDYPGLLAAEIERRYPGAVCLFFAGAVADQAPVKQGEGFEPAERIAQALAQQADTLLQQMAPTPPQALQAGMRVVPLPAARVRLSARWRLPRWLSRRLADNDATLTAWRLGDLVGLGAPCDLESTLGAELQAAVRARGWQPLVASFVNDYIGYCVSPERYDGAEYEALMAFNGREAGSQMVAELSRLAEQGL